jgi:hypothetical protein
VEHLPKENITSYSTCVVAPLFPTIHAAKLIKEKNCKGIDTQALKTSLMGRDEDILGSSEESQVRCLQKVAAVLSLSQEQQSVDL